MLHDIAYYKKIQDAYGAASKKQAQLNGLRKRINRDFKQPMNWEHVEVDGVAQELLVMKSTDKAIKKIEARPGDTLHLGALVKWHEIYWLVVTLDADDQVQFSGTMAQCNLILKWQLPDLTLAETYGVAEDATKYGTGVSDNELMRIGEFSLKVKVQMNLQTLQIQRDQRFLVGESGEGYTPNAYIASRLNQVTGTYVANEGTGWKNYGYVEVTLLEDQFRPHVDRADLMIADYIDPEFNSAEERPQGGVGW